MVAAISTTTSGCQKPGLVQRQAAQSMLRQYLARVSAHRSVPPWLRHGDTIAARRRRSCPEPATGELASQFLGREPGLHGRLHPPSSEGAQNAGDVLQRLSMGALKPASEWVSPPVCLLSAIPWLGMSCWSCFRRLFPDAAMPDSGGLATREATGPGGRVLRVLGLGSAWAASSGYNRSCLVKRSWALLGSIPMRDSQVRAGE